MKVVGALLNISQPRSLRELVDLTGLSPAGTKDVLRRLQEKDVVIVGRSGNKVLYSLVLGVEERTFLENALQQKTREELQRRAELFSARHKQAIGWIDETIRLLRLGKLGRRELKKRGRHDAH